MTNNFEAKSYLRKKWESFFLNIVNKRTPDQSLKNNEVLVLDNSDSLKNVLKKKTLDTNIKLVVISIPLNNFSRTWLLFGVDFLADRLKWIKCQLYVVVWEINSL